MQKLNKKKILGTVPKKLQLVETFWDCPEFSKGKNKGITLIALIITIIVMLILVGVTINVALNGGLFEEADTAVKQTQLEVDNEELQMAVIAALNGDLEIPNASAIKLEGWTIAGNDGGPYTCTSPNGNTFTVDEKGKITEGGNQQGGGNEPVAFDWGSVELTVDTSADYVWYDENSKATYLINFTDEGKAIIKLNGETLKIVDAIEDRDSETGLLKFNLTIPNVGTSDVTLEMDNNNGIDIIANILVMNEAIIYKKYETIGVYGPYPNTTAYVVLTVDKERMYVVDGKIAGREQVEIFEGTIEEFEKEYSKQYEEKENVQQLEIVKFILISDEIFAGISKDGYYMIGTTNDSNLNKIPELSVGEVVNRTELTLGDILQ